MSDFNLGAFSDAVADIAEGAAAAVASLNAHHGRTTSAFPRGTHILKILNDIENREGNHD